MINADRHILDLLDWCHKNPITVSILLPILYQVVRKTKNKLDDWLLKRVVKAIGKD